MDFRNPGCGLPQEDGFPEGEPVLLGKALPEATDSVRVPLGNPTAGEGTDCPFLIGDLQRWHCAAFLCPSLPHIRY